MTSKPIDQLIKALGGLTKAARAFGLENPSIVANWRSRESIPAERVLQAEALTGISRHKLRPDVFGPDSLKAKSDPKKTSSDARLLPRASVR